MSIVQRCQFLKHSLIKYSTWRTTIISVHSLVIFVYNYTHTHLISNPPANPAAFTFTCVQNLTPSSQLQHRYLRPGHHHTPPVFLHSPSHWSSSFQYGSPRSLFSTCKTLLNMQIGSSHHPNQSPSKVCLGHLKSNFWDGPQDHTPETLALTTAPSLIPPLPSACSGHAGLLAGKWACQARFLLRAPALRVLLSQITSWRSA